LVVRRGLVCGISQGLLGLSETSSSSNTEDLPPRRDMYYRIGSGRLERINDRSCQVPILLTSTITFTILLLTGIFPAKLSLT